MLLSLEGEECCGKTTLAYTAPRPVVGFAFDMGIERALAGAKHELFDGLKVEVKPYNHEATAVPGWAGNDITIYELPQPIQLDSVQVKGAGPLWSIFIQLITGAYTDQKVRSVVVDTMTVARRVKADAYLEALQKNNPNRERLIQIEYATTNDAIRSLYTTGAGIKKNLIAVHHLTDERKETVDANGKIVQALTGNRVLEGLAQTYRYMDIALRLEPKEITRKVEDKDVKTMGVSAAFQKCGYNLGLKDMVLLNPTWDSVCQMVEDTLGGRIRLERSNGSVI